MDKNERFGCLSVEVLDDASKIEQNSFHLMQLGQVDLGVEHLSWHADMQQHQVSDEKMDVHVE